MALLSVANCSAATAPNSRISRSWSLLSDAGGLFEDTDSLPESGTFGLRFSRYLVPNLDVSFRLLAIVRSLGLRLRKLSTQVLNLTEAIGFDLLAELRYLR
jgi:hypothetical protein